MTKRFCSPTSTSTFANQHLSPWPTASMPRKTDKSTPPPILSPLPLCSMPHPTPQTMANPLQLRLLALRAAAAALSGWATEQTALPTASWKSRNLLSGKMHSAATLRLNWRLPTTTISSLSTNRQSAKKTVSTQCCIREYIKSKIGRFCSYADGL